MEPACDNVRCIITLKQGGIRDYRVSENIKAEVFSFLVIIEIKSANVCQIKLVKWQLKAKKKR